MPVFRAIVCLLVVSLPLVSADPKLPGTVTLGGPRKVEAKIDRSESVWTVRVRMLAVTAFDPPTNARLNRDKARLFALQALTHFLTGKDSGELAVSGVEIVETGTDGPVFMLALTVPRDQVVIGGDATKPPPKIGERIASHSALFTRKHDLERTALSVADCLLGDLARVATEKGEAVERVIADIEERADAAFRVLDDEIAGEKLLLEIESKELREGVAKQKVRVFDALKAAVARQVAAAEPKAIDPPMAVTKAFRDIEIEPPFDTYLFANLLLMETARAKVFRLPDGKQIILAVASTVVKDGSAKDRLRAETVCRTKALASVVAEKEGVQVCRVERLDERTVVTIDNGKETATSVSELLQITKAQVEGVTKDMPVVGRWKSKDGTVFYMALGKVIDKP